MTVEDDYTAFVRSATGDDQRLPYVYQQRIAAEGLPELLAVPTGCGKTAAVVLGWLFRRRRHPDPAVHRSTPRWLVYTLPQRVLVEQTYDAVVGWLQGLGLRAEVGCHPAIGGQSAGPGRSWRDDVDRDAVIVGTQDMLISRALNRGYGDGRWLWPVDFGLLHAGCHWVFDEVQLMGPALPTSRQLDGLRRSIGVAAPCSSTWMSATVDDDALVTLDCPDIASRHELSDSDRSGALQRRLQAVKTIGHVEVEGKSYASYVADAIVGLHRPGGRTIVVLNTVERARLVRDQLMKCKIAPVVLVHSRFRPSDRARHVAAAIALPGAEGAIVVTTQVLEAGVDVSADVLVTEAAPWASIVQRAGRCNRDGEATDARLIWVAPPDSRPYEPDEVNAAINQLRHLDGESATPARLSAAAVPAARLTHAVLRRRDLLELFDTMPDMSGHDIDVTRFVRDADERTLEVAWLPLRGKRPTLRSLPGPEQRCPAPVGAVRDWLKGVEAWRHDHIDGEWVRCHPRDIRPGMVLVADVAAGGYLPEEGWAPTSTADVPAVGPGDLVDSDTAGDLAVGDDPGAVGRRRWLGLRRHCDDVGAEARRLIDSVDPTAVSAAHRDAAVLAARLHDIGKVHDVFQASLLRLIDDQHRAEAEACGPPWAKSASRRPLRHEGRTHFRHELVSALMLLGEGSVVLDGCADADLVRYLVAAHHGRARIGVRSLPEKGGVGGDGTIMMLGVLDGEAVSAVDLGDMIVPASRMDLSLTRLGDAADGSPSWTERMLALRDDPELGPFKLAYLEAMVRLADWRASRAADEREPA